MNDATNALSKAVHAFAEQADLPLVIAVLPNSIDIVAAGHGTAYETLFAIATLKHSLNLLIHHHGARKGLGKAASQRLVRNFVRQLIKAGPTDDTFTRFQEEDI